MFDLSQTQLEGFPLIKQVEMTNFVKNRIGKGRGRDEARDEKNRVKNVWKKCHWRAGWGDPTPNGESLKYV